jgi:hypothetical protein
VPARMPVRLFTALLGSAILLGLAVAPATAQSPSVPLPSSAAPFADVPQSSPFFTAIDDLRQAGIAVGYEQVDGTHRFEPNNSVLRAQMVKLVILALGLDVDPQALPPFVDLGPFNPVNPYPHAYLALAATLGIVRGQDPTHFGPWTPVSRQQATSMAARAIDVVRPGRLLDPPADFRGTWTELASPAHAVNARRAEYNLLLPGLPLGELSPTGSMSRQEAAVLVDQVYLATRAARDEGGIFGQVLLGPISPVERLGQVNERPYEADVRVLDAGDGREVARFRSRADGMFRLGLPPGTYRLLPSPGGSVYPRATEQTVSVEAARFTRVIIRYDTGIR